MPGYNLVGCDISGSIRDSLITVFGGLWTTYPAWHQFNQQFATLRFEYNVWGEIKFTSLSKEYLDFYQRIIQLFFETQELYFSCLIAKKSILSLEQRKNYDATNSDLTSIHISRQAMLKKYCRDQDILTILYDVGEIKDRERTEAAIKQYIEFNQYKLNKNIAINYSCQIASHTFPLLQMCDLLAGAVARKCRKELDNQDTNGWAKSQLVQYIEEQLQRYQARHSHSNDNYRLNEPTKDKDNIKLNRWFYQPYTQKKH